MAPIVSTEATELYTSLNDKKKETLACLVIDDPLLKPTYGNIDYSVLLQEMKEHSFFTEIAFIPWNYKRSNPNTIRLFAENPEYFAICVHGCDHTGNEFGKKDYNELVALSSTALWRMEQHKKITGLPYDPVIVFPQGKFSSTAMKVLKDLGYFAAFNSGLKALDLEDKYSIEPIEYLKPATLIYHDFPLFLRRYPEEMKSVLEDFNNGRPIIIVEHHGAFRNGYKEITDLVDWINNMGNVRWTSLLNIAEFYLNKKMGKIKNITDLSNKNSNTLVAVRRLLSEVRDNLIETNSFLTKIYKSLRNTFK